MKYDFSIQDEASLQNAEDCIVITCGKGKKDDNKIYIKAVEFSYIEGLIWDKYREYGSKVKTKISSQDWSRILEGFNECSTRLSNFVATDNIKEILQFNLYRSKYPVADVLNDIAELNELVKTVAVWLEANVKNEKHITILKSKKLL